MQASSAQELGHAEVSSRIRSGTVRNFDIRLGCVVRTSLVVRVGVFFHLLSLLWFARQWQVAAASSAVAL